MSPSTAIIVLLLVLLIGWAISRVVRRSKKGGGCCGSHEEALKRISVQDRNKNHYPYQRILTIGGMSCENCAVRVENALNKMPDTWAKADFSEKKATVLTKEEPDEHQLRKAVTSAGYSVLDIH